ncbi:potassium channel family protein [Pseudonocardia pini]|uniref:potassium channel family protein n=1 Tax=Pseudonocardia pini TaxID=2758030 RepID=UPI0015F087F3|nr:potassium channel protein [Pseudonocardia pini]
MGNPLLSFWLRLLGQDEPPPRRGPSGRLRRRIPMASAVEAEATIFLILRRMRTPLIVLITIFAVSVLGLTLVPGASGRGMSFFDAFYFMSYTASTIGFGELPDPFTAAQRLWVTAAIYLTVIGWAYAIGSLLALVQDRAFRRALALQHFTRKVKRLREPFLLIVGHGRTGELLCHSFDAMGKRVVVIDVAEDRIVALELGSYRGDVPGLVADGRDPGHLGVAGLRNPRCEAVLALTDDDEANLAVAMTAALLRPDLPVIARTVSPTAAERIRAFGTPTVVNAFDRFGDHLRVAMRAPASYQLMTWLESGPGAELPDRGRPPGEGHWVVCGYGRFGREVTADLRAEGLEVTVVETRTGAGDAAPADGGVATVQGSGSDPDVLERAGVEGAVGFVAGTDNDTTNLSMVADARRLNPSIFVAARQNRPASAPLFAAMEVDSLLVPAEVVAHEVFAQLSTPLLWRFLQQVPAQGDRWATQLIDRITAQCGHRLTSPWKVRLNRGEAPALVGWLGTGEARLGDVLRDPERREDRLAVVVLMILRRDADGDEECLMAPADDVVLAPDDELILIGGTAARRGLDVTMLVDAAREYVQTGRRVPNSWLWRKLARTGPAG